MLSLAQAVLFVTTVVALGLTDARRLMRRPDRATVTMLLALAASLLGAKLIGGFFVSGSFPPAGGMFDTGFSLNHFSGDNTVLGQLQWNLASFGVLLVLGSVGLLRARQGKDFLVILAALSLVIVNALRYRYSWDIVKFGTVGFIALAIGAGMALSDFHRRASRFRGTAVYTVLLFAVAGQGLIYPYVWLYASYSRESRKPFSTQMITPYLSRSYPVDGDDAQAVNFLRTHMGASDIVYRIKAKSEPYAIWGGLPTQASVIAPNGDDDVYGLGEQRLAARRDLDRVSQDWFDRLAAQHVTWLVTDADDAMINAVVDCPEGLHRAALAAQYGDVRVFRLE